MIKTINRMSSKQDTKQIGFKECSTHKVITQVERTAAITLMIDILDNDTSVKPLTIIKRKTNIYYTLNNLRVNHSIINGGMR